MALNILVVDDTRSIADIVKDTLEMEGHRVDVAYSGIDGREILNRGKHEFYIFDKNNPLKNGGYELLAEVRTRYGEVPVYLITGEATKDEEIKAKQAGFKGVIKKPFDLNILSNIVSNVEEKTSQ